jgi:hypothetical protein
MAIRRDELPVLTEAYRLAGVLVPAVDRMPRGIRSILGGEIVREAVGLCCCLHEAAVHGGKLDALRRADVHLTRTRVVVRMAFDQRACSAGVYETATERGEVVGKMLGGWFRSVRGSSAAAPGLVEKT